MIRKYYKSIPQGIFGNNGLISAVGAEKIHFWGLTIGAATISGSSAPTYHWLWGGLGLRLRLRLRLRRGIRLRNWIRHGNGNGLGFGLGVRVGLNNH
jgi:hypothetical protein